MTSSSLRNAAQLDVYGAVRRPGPFDVPPPEPVLLASPLPWELEESGEGAVADWVNRLPDADGSRPAANL